MIGEFIMIILKAIMIVYLFVVKVVHEYFFLRIEWLLKKLANAPFLYFSASMYIVRYMAPLLLDELARYLSARRPQKLSTPNFTTYFRLSMHLQQQQK